MRTSSELTDDLRELAAHVVTMPVGDDTLDGIERIRQLEVLKNACAAAQQREAIAFADRRRVEDAAAGVPSPRRGAAATAEIALARRISPSQAQRWLGLARILRDELPATFAQLAAGAITEHRAMLVARETIFLSRAHRAEVDAELAHRLPELGDARVEAESRRLAQHLDPNGAADRARNSAKDRRVTVRPAPDTMARLSILLPIHQGVAGYAVLRKHADALIAVGAQGTNPDGSLRTRNHIMADTAVERLTGQAAADDVPVEVHLVMSDQALLHSGPEPGLVLGAGPVAAPLARELALGRQNSPAKRWLRRLYLAPDGSRLAAMDSSRREFTANQRLFIRLRDHDVCRNPWCDAPVRHIDHVATHASGGTTTVANGQGYCAACNYAKQSPGWRTEVARNGTITTITPSGHRYRSREPAPPGRPPVVRRYTGPAIVVEPWVHARAA